MNPIIYYNDQTPIKGLPKSRIWQIKYHLKQILKLIFYNGFISGTILINKNRERRFVVLQGNHRMAILSHLGFDKIQARNYSGKFNQNKLANLPLVSEGICDYDTANKIFNLFFIEDGKHLLQFMKT
jgi:hypothetical protein